MVSEIGENLREAMRHWITGVSIVTSSYGGFQHGMTVNSLTSVSLDPPLITVTLDNRTRTHGLVQQSSKFGISILAAGQEEIANRFAGKGIEASDRFGGLDTFLLHDDIPMITGGIAFLICRVYASHPLAHSTLFIGEVIEARQAPGEQPLVYFNRQYHRMTL